MSRQRCAGRRGGKAEFPCGLMGRGWAEALRCRLGVCRGASLSTGSVSNCGGIFGWVLLDKGVIVEIGNHETLMEKKGYYHALVSSQMQC